MTRRHQLRAARTLVALGLVLITAGFLGGCQTTQTVYVDRVEVVRPAVAPSLLRCRPEPEPLAPGARQRDVAPYVLDLVEAGADCRRKLGTVATRLKEHTP